MNLSHVAKHDVVIASGVRLGLFHYLPGAILLLVYLRVRVRG